MCAASLPIKAYEKLLQAIWAAHQLMCCMLMWRKFVCHSNML